MTLSSPNPIAVADDIRQIATPYLPDLSFMRANIAKHALDTIETVCHDIALCQIGAATADRHDYIAAHHAIQQAATTLHYALRGRLTDTDTESMAAAGHRLARSSRVPAAT